MGLWGGLCGSESHVFVFFFFPDRRDPGNSVSLRSGFRLELTASQPHFCLVPALLPIHPGVFQAPLAINWTVSLGRRCANVLISSISESDLLWGQGVYRGNQLKMRSLGWAVIQDDWCPYKKGKVGHRDRDVQGKEGHVTGVMQLQVKKNQESP